MIGRQELLDADTSPGRSHRWSHQITVLINSSELITTEWRNLYRQTEVTLGLIKLQSSMPPPVRVRTAEVDVVTRRQYHRNNQQAHKWTVDREQILKDYNHLLRISFALALGKVQPWSSTFASLIPLPRFRILVIGKVVD